MYLMNDTILEQLDRTSLLRHKPFTHSHIHWLNPLLYKCKEHLHPEPIHH